MGRIRHGRRGPRRNDPETRTDMAKAAAKSSARPAVKKPVRKPSAAKPAPAIARKGAAAKEAAKQEAARGKLERVRVPGSAAARREAGSEGKYVYCVIRSE